MHAALAAVGFFAGSGAAQIDELLAPVQHVAEHVAADGAVILGGDEYTAETLRIGLRKELAVISSEGKSVEDANVIIRAHRDAAAGDVQEIIRVAQDQKLINFALRVKEDRS